MVYFAYDKSIITTAFGEALQKNYEWIAENPDVQIQLEGHCDERGTNEYNLALGERRAKAVFEYLINLEPVHHNFHWSVSARNVLQMAEVMKLPGEKIGE